MRVVVVGAGLAGLAAAEGLVRAGVEVVVLEARDRVGGRVWSTTIANGAIVELGAEFVLPGHDVVRETCARLGLELADKRMLYGDREPRGVAVDAAQLHFGVEAVRAALECARRSRRRASTPRASSTGSTSQPAVRETIRSRAEVSCAATADRFPASALAHVAAISPRRRARRCVGGNQLIALRLAEELGSAVRLGTVVERVAWDDAGVRVSAGGAEVEADRVVLAVPASVVGRIVFEPALPPPLADACSAVSYGNAAKLFVPLRSAPPPSAVLSVPERYWTWTAAAGAGVQPVLHAFAGSAPALAALRLDEGSRAWVESVARLRPDLELVTEGAVLSTWDDDPWVGAAYSCDAPGEEAWGPVGPFHACGEHTAGAYAALMEGALRSGRRVADEILGG